MFGSPAGILVPYKTVPKGLITEDTGINGICVVPIVIGLAGFKYALAGVLISSITATPNLTLSS